MNLFEQELERNPILERRDENEAQTDTGAGGIDDGSIPEAGESRALDQQSPGQSVNDIDTDYVNIDPDAGVRRLTRPRKPQLVDAENERQRRWYWELGLQPRSLCRERAKPS